jgi:hypothetical protein
MLASTANGLAANEPFLHAARHHRLKQLAQEVALAKPTMTVLGEGRMVGNRAIEPQPAEPTVGQIEVDLVA